MSRPEIPKLLAGSVAEVRAFLKVARELDEWKRKYPSAARALAEMAPRYMAAHKAADAAVRTQSVAAGPWVVRSLSLKPGWPERFADSVGHGEFVRMGGSIEMTNTFAFDAKRFEAVCDREKIPEDQVARIAQWTISYDKPGELAIP